jgi:hypothetical protein
VKVSVSRGATVRLWAGVAAVISALALSAAAFGSAATGSTGTRTDPFKRGAVVLVGGGFAVRVVSVDTKASRMLAAGTDGIRGAPPGQTDVLVTMRATNRAKVAGIPFVDGSLGAIGAAGAPYSSLTESCGTVPSDVSTISPIPAGKSETVRTCWQVVKLDADTLVMFYEPYSGAPRMYFALRDRAR